MRCSKTVRTKIDLRPKLFVYIATAENNRRKAIWSAPAMMFRHTVVMLGGSNEIEIFGRIFAFLVSYASEFQAVSFDSPYDTLI